MITAEARPVGVSTVFWLHGADDDYTTAARVLCERGVARIIHEEADYSRKTNAPVWYKGCAHRPFATTEALA